MAIPLHSQRVPVEYQEKSLMAPDDYKKQLTGLLLELARAQEAIDK